MSKLSWVDDGPAVPQTILANVAASDAGPKRKRRRKSAPVTFKRKSPPLAFGEWVITCYSTYGDRFFFDFKGTYAEAVIYRDKHLATGRYEKAWLRSKI